MPNFITTTLTYVKEDVNNYFLQPIFIGDNGLSRFFVRTNVKSSYKVQKFGKASKLTKAFQSGFQGSTGTTVTQRDIVVARAKAEASQEADEFFNTVVGEWLARGNDKDQLEDAENLKEIIAEIMMKGVMRDLTRQIWLNDTGSASADYDMYDGIFKNYESLPAGQMLVGPVGALAADAAVAQMQLCIDAMPDEFREMKGDAIFEISGSYADNYRATLRDRGTEIADGVLRDGEENLSYDGVKIIVHREWDTHIAADALATDVHRIVLHLPKNIEVGTDLDAAQDAVFWYNIDLIENRWRVTYALGTNFRNEEYAVTNISA